MQNDNINKKSKRVSMRDIAEKLGISKVSGGSAHRVDDPLYRRSDDFRALLCVYG